MKILCVHVFIYSLSCCAVQIGGDVRLNNILFALHEIMQTRVTVNILPNIFFCVLVKKIEMYMRENPYRYSWSCFYQTVLNIIAWQHDDTRTYLYRLYTFIEERN